MTDIDKGKDSFWSKQYTFHLSTIRDEKGDIAGRKIAIVDNIFNITRIYHTKYDLKDIGDIIIQEAQIIASRLMEFELKLLLEESKDEV